MVISLAAVSFRRFQRVNAMRKWILSKGLSAFAVQTRCYDGDIMMSRTQITLEPEIQRRARQRANDLGISFAEYIRRLVARDLGSLQTRSDPTSVFDLGASVSSDIARNKSAMIAAAFGATPKNPRRRNPAP